jgi:hypothetical protein
MAAEAQPVSALDGLLCPAALQEQTVPLLLRLELGRQQVAEMAEQAFALIAAESARRQHQLLQEAAAAAAAGSSSSEGSDSGSGDGSSNAGHAPVSVDGDKIPAKVTADHMPPGAAAVPDAQVAALAVGSSDAAMPAAAAALKPLAYHLEIQGPDGKIVQQEIMQHEPLTQHDPAVHKQSRGLHVCWIRKLVVLLSSRAGVYKCCARASQPTSSSR